MINYKRLNKKELKGNDKKKKFMEMMGGFVERKSFEGGCVYEGVFLLLYRENIILLEEVVLSYS